MRDDIRDKMGGIFGYTYEERMKCEKDEIEELLPVQAGMTNIVMSFRYKESKAVKRTLSETGLIDYLLDFSARASSSCFFSLHISSVSLPFASVSLPISSAS